MTGFPIMDVVHDTQSARRRWKDEVHCAECDRVPLLLLRSTLVNQCLSVSATTEQQSFWCLPEMATANSTVQ